MEKNYPKEWSDCGTAKGITGCRFSISAMSDNFVAMILGAIKNVNTQKVLSMTDELSTVYRGKRIHVIDCVKSCFVNINDGKTHVTMEATFANGCSVDFDDNCNLAQDAVLLNNNTQKFKVLSKIAFYPLGISDYIDHVAYVVNLAREKKLLYKIIPYATMIVGDVNDIFDFFNVVLEYAEKNISHYVLQVSLSVNSPTNNN